jgi:hypothetical protein
MIEVEGDLWTFQPGGLPPDAIVITTNGYVNEAGECVMGRGCALQAKQRYPGLPYLLGKYIKRWGNRPFVLLPRGCPGDYALLSMPVKHVWSDPADPALIATSAGLLRAIVDKFGYERVLVPRPGCGNGRLAWADVRPLLEEHFDDRFFVIDFPGGLQ